MKQKNLLGIAILFLAIISVSMVIAEDSDQKMSDQLNGQALNVRYDHLGCKVNLTNTQIDLIDKYISQAPDLSAHKDRLNSDMNKLSDLMDNKTSFDSFVSSTLRPDFDNATKDIKDVKKNFKSYNLSNETRTAFKNDLKAAVSTYSDCVNNEEKKMSKIWDEQFNLTENRWKGIIKNMHDKNITTDEVNTSLDQLITKIKALQAAIGTNNVTLIRQAMQDLKNNNLHLWANFEKGRMNGYIGKMMPLAERFNKTDDINKMRKKISDIENLTANGSRYRQGDFEKIWSTLENTSKDLKNASSEILQQRNMQRRRGQ